MLSSNPNIHSPSKKRSRSSFDHFDKNSSRSGDGTRNTSSLFLYISRFPVLHELFRRCLVVGFLLEQFYLNNFQVT